jgi:hypothetical protein
MVCQEESSQPADTTRADPFPDADIRVGNFVISGVRTYSVILLIMVTYCYLAIKATDSAAAIEGLRDLALMAAGFIFGAKVVSRK